MESNFGSSGMCGQRGGERLLGILVAAHPRQDAAPHEQAIGVIAGGLAFEQRMGLAAEELAKHDRLEVGDGTGRPSAEVIGVRLLQPVVAPP